MVASAERLADLGQAVLGQLLGQGHRNLPRPRQRAHPPLGQQILQTHVEVLRRGLLDVRDGDGLRMGGQQVAQGFFGEIGGDRLAVEIGARGQGVECAFQVTHVRTDALGQQHRHALVQRHALVVGLGQQDRRARLEVRRFDRHAEPPSQARLQSGFELVDLLRVTVAGQADLLLGFEQRVEGVEKLFLGGVLAGEELDVVDEQRVDRAETPLEFVHAFRAQGLDHRADELFRPQVQHLAGGIAFQHQVACRMHQMGLAQAGAAIQQQRVVGTPRVGGHLHGGGLAELVGLAFHEGFECVMRIHVVLEGLRRGACRHGAGRRHRPDGGRPR